MKEYYKADNELVKQLVDLFDCEDLVRQQKDDEILIQHGISPRGLKSIRKEFEIGGRTWICTGSGWMNNDDGSLPTDRRMEGEVELTQEDGTTHPKITLTINVGPGQ